MAGLQGEFVSPPEGHSADGVQPPVGEQLPDEPGLEAEAHSRVEALLPDVERSQVLPLDEPRLPDVGCFLDEACFRAEEPRSLPDEARSQDAVDLPSRANSADVVRHCAALECWARQLRVEERSSPLEPEPAHWPVVELPHDWLLGCKAYRGWRDIMRAADEHKVQRKMDEMDQRLLREYLDETIPPKDRFADLATLQPSAKSQMPVEFQQRIMDEMRAGYFSHWAKGKGNDEPTYEHREVHGWAFFGPAGWSKSTLCTAWFAQYARENIMDINQLTWNRGLLNGMEIPKGRFPQSMWRMNALNLIDETLSWQHRDFSDKAAKQPRVSSAWIEQVAGFHPLLYLEEVDKVRNDKTRLDILFDVINALYNYKGVLLLNSNLTKQEFAAQFGPEFARRIGEMCNVVDCFAQDRKLCCS